MLFFVSRGSELEVDATILDDDGWQLQAVMHAVIHVCFAGYVDLSLAVDRS